MASPRTQVTPRAETRRQNSAVRTAASPVEREAEDRPENRGDRLLIVGVGASAGGLEAFTLLLNRLPVDTGMGFVLVEGAEARKEAEASPLPVRGRGARRAGEQDGLKKTLLLLRNHSGVDFSLYNPSTLRRRINRRMVLNKTTD